MYTYIIYTIYLPTYNHEGSRKQLQHEKLLRVKIV